MTDKDFELEREIHELLCGGLDEDGIRTLMERLVRDKQAVALLETMLRTQRQARAALGYSKARGAIERSLRDLMKTLPPETPDEDAPRPVRPSTRPERLAGSPRPRTTRD